MALQNITELLARSLPSERLDLLHILAYQASLLRMPLYMVGGVVRDILLGRTVKDFDLVVEGNSAEFAQYIVKKFGGRTIIHSKFKTATWVLNEATLSRLNVPSPEISTTPLSFDLISARSETYEFPGALPTVKLSDIGEDLRRRDFTVNAMAVRVDSDQFGAMFDPLNGQQDLEARLIRVLHDRSFVDDPTRMLRAVRYAVRYGFELAPETRSLINDSAFEILTGLSGERLRHEFELIFEEEQPAEILQRLRDLGLLAKLHLALVSGDEKRLAGLTDYPPLDFGDFAVPDILSFRQSLGWVLYLLNNPTDAINSLGKRLAFPALLSKAVRGAATLRGTLTALPDWKPSQWTFHLDEIPALAVYGVWLVTAQPALKEYLTHWRNIKPYTSGYTLQQRGLEPGPRYKQILTRLRAAWLDGEVKSEKAEMELLRSLLPKD